MSSQVVEQIESLLSPVLQTEGYELVHVEHRQEPSGWVLRVFMDKAGGLTLTDCEVWNDRIGALVDGAGLITQSYSLEISSPGLNRPLKKEADFSRFMGEQAIIKTFAPINGQRNFHGKIAGVQSGVLTLEDRTNGTVSIPIGDMASARIDPALDFNQKKGFDL
ncbi:MAG TPA: ribosome maturation factor RimP [Elusimicrobiota bacterium]|nr:ribosome maturation factor RimP [Elusimicrobiota bacterium]